MKTEITSTKDLERVLGKKDLLAIAVGQIIGAGIFSCTEFNKANTHSVSLEYDYFSSTAVSQVNENAFSMPLGPEWQMHFYRSQISFYISIASGVITICSAISLFICSQLRRKADTKSIQRCSN